MDTLVRTVLEEIPRHSDRLESELIQDILTQPGLLTAFTPLVLLPISTWDIIRDRRVGRNHISSLIQTVRERLSHREVTNGVPSKIDDGMSSGTVQIGERQ